MPFYHRLGEIPPKRHIAFPKQAGGIHYEHLMGNLGFTGLQSLLYTLRRPSSKIIIIFGRDSALILPHTCRLSLYP